jgi:selenocysteine lyase/cysteine desulfurase
MERPTIVAIDSPRRCAPDGQSTRADERRLARTICGIRWTPDQRRVRASVYYAWVVEGLALFDALEGLGFDTIEVFLTASWTRWNGARGGRSRSDWSREGLTTSGGRGRLAWRDAMAGMRISEAQALWEPTGVYCNTASYGLPPRPAWDALQSALAEWHSGRTSWEHWGQSTEDSRTVFARLVGVDVERVAVGSTVSELVGSVVTALPPGARVVVPEIEFTSMLFPLLVQQRLDVRTVPAAGLVDAIAEGVEVVAFSAVQMSSGEVADLDAIVAAAASVDAITLCDATQALGWLPLQADRFDAVVCSAYKWLMSPRGSALMTVSDRLLERVVPHSAGWYAGEDVHASYFGPPLRLASSARRLDVSPAWFSWVGTQPALELVERVGIPAIHTHNLALANRFRAGVSLEPSNSAIVCVDAPGAAERLQQAGIIAAVRGGRLRTSWHVYNDETDVDQVLDLVAG